MEQIPETTGRPDERAIVTYKTTPRPYQQLIVEKTASMPALALFLEQGLGKSKVALDTAAVQFIENGVEGLVVISKTTVVENWKLAEIPAHLSVAYEPYLYSTRTQKKVPPAKLMPQGCLKIVLINDGCARTDHGYKYLEAFMKQYKCGLVVDESTIIKNPTATITKRLLKLSTLAFYTRILCGEPAPQGAADYYSQYKFLNPKILNVGTFTAYKSMYCEQESIWINGRQIMRPTGAFTPFGKMAFEDSVKPYTVRLRKADVLTDLPPKQYIVKKYQLPPTVQKMYDKLRDDFMTELVIAESAGELTALLAISRATRLHQIVSGHAPNDEGTMYEFDSGRVAVLEDILSERPPGSKTIIWAHYRSSIDSLHARLSHLYGAGFSQRVYGGVSETERQAAFQAFKTDPKCQVLIANAASAGWGLTFTEADACIYYSNSYNYEHRAQSEDRIHRIGQVADSVQYYDIVAEGTVDEKIMETLARKGDFSKSVMTNYAEWFGKRQ